MPDENLMKSGLGRQVLEIKVNIANLFRFDFLLLIEPKWQFYLEGCADAFSAVDIDRTVVQLDDLKDQGQSQSGAGFSFDHTVIRAVERFKDVFQFILLDADAGVGDRDQRLVIRRIRKDDINAAAALFGVHHRILDDVV